ALAALALAGTARAGDPLEEKKDALLAQEWVKKGRWTTDLAAAKEEAKRSGKPIFAYFTVTTPESPFSRNIEKTLLGDEKFLAWSKGWVCYVHVTWSEKSNYDELEKAKGRAWPWFAFLDAEGGLIYPLRPAMALQAFEEAGERVKRYVELSRKAEKGSDAEKRDLVIAALDLGRIKAEGEDGARARLEKLGELSAEQKKALELAETNAFVMAVAMATDTSDKEAHLAAGRKFIEHKKAGKPLPTARADFQAYWLAIMRVAQEEKDAALYEEGVKALAGRYGQEPTSKAFFEKCAKTLEELKAGKK